MTKEEYMDKYFMGEDEAQWFIDNEINPEEEMVVTWPESQVFLGHPDGTLINDEKGYSIFGGSAYLLPVDAKPVEDY